MKQILVQEKEPWEEVLKRLHGSEKDRKKRPFTKEIREKLAREMTEEEANRLMKLYGL